MEQPATEVPDEARAGWAALAARQPRSTLVVLAVSLAGWALLAWLVFDMGHPLARLTMPGSSDWSVANVVAIFAMGLKSLFVLSTRTTHWFIERGFAESEPASLPERKAALYNYDRRSKVFSRAI